MAEVAGVILAGGLATRMGGGDKALLSLEPPDRREGGCRTLLDEVVGRLRPQCAKIVLNANGDAVRFARFGLPVVADAGDDRPGPLAGILAGMDWADANGLAAIVTVAADTPFFPRDLVARLRAAAAMAGLPIALAASPDDAGALRRHPTFGLWPVHLRDDLRATLADGRRKVVAFADRHGAAVAAFAGGPPDPFFNVNTPADLAQARSISAAGIEGRGL